MHQTTGELSHKRAVMTYRSAFIQRWQRFCHANFDSPSHLEKVFAVDRKTSRNWWDGMNAPQGWVVAKALADPEYRQSALNHIAAE